MSNLMKKFEEEFGLTVREDGKVVTNSIKVALVYGKEHYDVVKKIKKFIDLIPELANGNFSVSEYKDVTGRVLPMYIMDRQGFSMLVNKFTGDEATIFTHKYSQAFEQMVEEIKQLKEEVKTISTIALSDKEQSQRLLEMNLHDFSERRTQRKFSDCTTYTEYKLLYDRFVAHAKTLDASIRVIRSNCAIKGMEKLRISLMITDPTNAGYAMLIDCDIKYLLRQIDKSNNKILGGEKGGKTRTINGLNDKLENCILYPKPDEFTWLDTHGFSNNYLYAYKEGSTKKSENYIKWLSNFPYKQMTPKDKLKIDWTKPLEMFIQYITIPSFDSHNCGKSLIDTIVTKYYGIDDNIAQHIYSERVGTCDGYSGGKIGYCIRNRNIEAEELN